VAGGGRSVFYFCQIIKAINDLLAGDWPSFARLFHRRQRLQLTIGVKVLLTAEPPSVVVAMKLPRRVQSDYFAFRFASSNWTSASRRE
jgi:hypothetical protein